MVYVSADFYQLTNEIYTIYNNTFDSLYIHL